ncbi:HEAT repeat domain-containing protein [Engelhardtia mirabilis]|uniref:HEAT repeat protein n=1 Tax=Engelhardtia mirabilis TaxID=2528011 RepID=A0A518BI38_9BACT|nr:hypothetical protein Pla133_17240 [Planctomycetes bacterium Pla133]QDV00974.1 hypothetical protein Pla86_17230 [Planctomycetes bacterium Pla86]
MTRAHRSLLAGLAVLPFAVGCAASQDDPVDNRERLSELAAMDAAPATDAELEAARDYLRGLVQSLSSSDTGAVRDWSERAGRPPAPKVLAALVDRRDASLGAVSPDGVPGLYLAQMVNGADDPRAVSAVVSLLYDLDPRWRVFGCEVVAHLSGVEAKSALRETLEDRDPAVSEAAASALAQLGDPVGLPILLDAGRRWADAGSVGALPYRHHFARLAKADFGDDFASYEKWFELHPPAVR